MPRRDEHVAAGMLLAAVVEGASEKDLSPAKALLEMIGAIGGGYAGGRAPDVLEPAVGFNHWGSAHSIAAGTGLPAALIKWGTLVRTELRVAGDDCFAAQATCQGEFVPWLLCGVGGIAMYLASGLLIGFVVGYASHLALDQMKSKRNLPLLCKSL